LNIFKLKDEIMIIHEKRAMNKPIIFYFEERRAKHFGGKDIN
jgi:hypothetical protein